MIKNKKQNIINIIESSRYPVFFTGNCLSSLSGVPSFNGKILDYPIKEILEINFYKKNRELFLNALTEIFQWTKLEPSDVHKTIAKFNMVTITESIDGLHQKAGNNKVIELHGNLNSLICKYCNNLILKQCKESYFKSQNIKCNTCSNLNTIDIVLSGESINNFNVAVNEIYKSDLLIVIGSDLSQWPANKVVDKAIKNGCKIIKLPVNGNSFIKP